jgi:opacity protein-like surface antigen
MHRIFLTAASLAALSGALVTSDALAQQAPAAPAAPAAPPSWWDSYKVSGYLDAGITFNPDSPSNGINFGHLYTDRANTPLMNQLSAIATRPLDPKATGFDYGFTMQLMYGTDARYTHFFNEFDRVINSRYQFDVVEADLLVHAPTIAGGTDFHIGQYPTPVGYEVINPALNPLYSHSYIYNFSIPIKHTGFYSVTHATPIVDLYLGLDWGNLAQPLVKGDNNEAIAGLAGFNLTLLDGNLTILALTHIGPENPSTTFFTQQVAPGAGDINGTNRYFNDIVITLKVNDALTLTSELNYVKDDLQSANFHSPSAYGFAQYATYALNDMLTLQGRAEIWRDDQGFYAAAFPANFDFTNSLRGIANTSFNAGKATYEEFTVGVNVKPPLPDSLSHFNGAMLRPEFRYDHADQAKPFNSLTSDHQFTLGVDLVLPF